MNNRKSDGIAYEQHTAQWLRDSGYTSVTTTKSSGDKGADVFYTNPINHLKYVGQCKYYSQGHKVGVSAVQEVYTAKSYYNCDRAVIFTNSELTSQAFEMARRLDVEVRTHFFPAVQPIEIVQIIKYCDNCGQLGFALGNYVEGMRCPKCGGILSDTPSYKLQKKLKHERNMFVLKVVLVNGLLIAIGSAIVLFFILKDVWFR